MIFLAALMLAFSMPVNARWATSNWVDALTKLKVLTSNRADVESSFKFLGAPNELESKLGTVVEYRIKAGEITVLYSRGKCGEGNFAHYDVPPNIVLDFDLVLSKEISIDKTNFDVSKFEKRSINDVVGLYNYVDEMNGLYLTGTDKSIRSIWLYPPKSRDYMRCRAT